jgi:Uma2 family endonuclease
MHTHAKFFNMTVEEYLKLDLQSVIRYEYIDGQVYPMLGDSEKLRIITSNLLIKLRSHVGGSECRVCSSDVKLRIESLNIFYHPEISVTCDPQDRDKLFKTRPRLIIEVISPSTERLDRIEKQINYRQLKSLQEYVLVSESEIKVDVYRKYNQENWVLQTLSAGDILVLTSVDLQINVLEIYEDIDF